MNRLQSERIDDFILIHLYGEVDLSWSQEIRRMVLDALEHAPHVGVMLADVSYIDSSGIAALVEGLQRARSKDRRFTLIAVSEAVRAVLELTRLDRVFTLVTNLEAARGAHG